MCVSRKVLNNLCDLFPVTADNLKKRGLQKRKHYLKAMLRLDNHPKTKYRALSRSQHQTTQQDMALVKNLLKDTSTDSILNKEGIQALGEAAANVEKFEVDHISPRNRLLTDDQSPHLPTPYDEDFLEDFFSDEDDRGTNPGVEDLQGVMKRVSKKAALMVEGIHACQARIDHNFGLIKQYLNEGKRPYIEFKRQIKGIASEFVKVADIRFGRVDAEQVYGEAQQDWQR